MQELGLWQIAYFALVVIGSFVIRGTTGFGGNVISIPLLALVLPLTVIVPAFAAIGLIAGIGQAVVSWRHIAWDEIKKSVPVTVVGVVLGTLLFSQLAHYAIFNRLLGIFIMLYALYALVGLVRKRHNISLRRPSIARAVVSFLAGFLGMIFGQGGQLYAVYLDRIKLDKGELRATLSCFLVLTAILRCAGYMQTGFFTSAVVITTAVALPAMTIGMFIGQFVHIKASKEAISGLIMVILLLSGAALVF